jgi:hypothetical protein
MATKPRKPMNFTITPEPAPAPVSIVRAADADRQQVGARVTKASYRQLKARAALSGVTVRTLVEQAIDEFLAKPTS